MNQPTTEYSPREALEKRVARRICKVVYGAETECACERRGRDQVCENMVLAAQHAMQEIIS